MILSEWRPAWWLPCVLALVNESYSWLHQFLCSVSIQFTFLTQPPDEMQMGVFSPNAMLIKTLASEHNSRSGILFWVCLCISVQPEICTSSFDIHIQGELHPWSFLDRRETLGCLRQYWGQVFCLTYASSAGRCVTSGTPSASNGVSIMMEHLYWRGAAVLGDNQTMKKSSCQDVWDKRACSEGFSGAGRTAILWLVWGHNGVNKWETL